MYSRLTRIALTFAIVLVAYFSYALAVVPLIEPVAVEDSHNQDWKNQPFEKRDPQNDPLLVRLKPFLPVDGWEFEDQTMLMGSDQFTLLIHDYDTLDEDTVLIRPCTLVFFPDGEPTKAQPEPNFVVLRAPQGAELSFDDGVDLSRLKMGKMRGGVLRGEVTIEGLLRSSDKQPAEDTSGGVVDRSAERLRLVTSNVQLTEERIWTNEVVQFELGQNRGSGRKLSIELAEVEEIQGTQSEKKRSVQSIEISEDVRLQLAVTADNNPLEPGDVAASSPDVSELVDITCRGAFRFDALSLVATFEDQVDVVRNGAGGPLDHLACERLSVYFDGDKANKMKPRRIEAAGHPVIGRRPGEDAELNCERLVYHLESGEISLKSTSQVRLRRGEDLVEASQVRFQPGPDSSIGEILASGKGHLQANLPDKKQGRVSANWTKELRLRPHEGKTLLSVLGEATVRFAEMGTLSSNEIWMWLLEQPQTGTSNGQADDDSQPAAKLTPHSMLANGRVTIDSAQLIGHTERLEMWFTPTNHLTRPNAAVDRGPAGLRPGVNSPASGDNAKDRRSRYQVRGDVVRVQLATDGKATALRDVTIAGNVEMREETPAGAAEKKALSVRGSSLQLLGADVENTRLVVSGDDQADALVEANGLTLSGAKIEGNKAGNTLAVNGPGSMQLPMNKSLAGESSGEAMPLKIDWQGGMRFDGQQIRFEKNVTARTQHQLVRTSRLIATLSRDIDFANPGRIDDVGLKTVHCPDLVAMESRTVTDGQVQSIDRMQLRNLQIDQTTGAIQAAGPGWIKSHRYGGQMELGGGPPAGAPPADDAASTLVFLRVDFQQSMTGNFLRKRLTFNNQVKCVYGPIPDWQQELDSSGLNRQGPQEVQLSCDRLALQEMPGGRASARNIDIDATGNMQVNGAQFSAQGERLSYNTGKEMLTLEGTTQRDAELWRDNPSGGPRNHVAARKIEFWKNTNRVKVHGARFLDLSGPGG